MGEKGRDGRGGCCIARYASAAAAAGDGGGTYDMSKMDRILLRFRPIAPKPIAGVSVSGGSSAENSQVSVRSGRTKRRYVRECKNSKKRCRNSKKKASETVVTLPLLPETPDQKDSPANVNSEPQKKLLPVWLNDNSSNRGGHVSVKLDRRAVMGSIVTVECVTDTWVDLKGLEYGDLERIWNLELDTCPGFVSDGLNRVGWTNEAYREMVGHEGSGELVVRLVMKVGVPITCSAFTCRVRVQYTWGKERSSSMTVPCDVWRMDGGGFAWRLDVKAALSLGR